MVDAGSVGRSPIQSPQIIPAPSMEMPIVSTLTITPGSCLVDGQLGAPMKAYEAIMQWSIRSVRSGYVFRDTPITSQKTVLSRVTKRLNRDALTPTWETLHLPYTDVTVKVAYFSMAI